MDSERLGRNKRREPRSVGSCFPRRAVPAGMTKSLSIGDVSRGGVDCRFSPEPRGVVTVHHKQRVLRRLFRPASDDSIGGGQRPNECRPTSFTGFLAVYGLPATRYNHCCGDNIMNKSLQRAFDAAAQLPPDEQDAIGAWLLAELQSEQKWTDSFARSQETLASLASEAVEEHLDGKTQDLDPKDI